MDPTIIPILNAQQQGMSAWAHGVNVLPELAQASAQNLTLQMLKQEKEKVQAPGEGKDSSRISEREKGNGNAWQEQRHGERRPKAGKPAEEAGNERPGENPLTGKLLNVRT